MLLTIFATVRIIKISLMMDKNPQNDYSNQQIKKYIDVERVLREKNPGLAKLLPKFIINYLIKIVHEADLNQAINRNSDKWDVDFLQAILNDFQVSIKVRGFENIPNEGRFLVASNHPMGGLDGMALICAIGKKFENPKIPVNDILLFLPNTTKIFIPINKHGSNSSYFELIESTFASDQIVIYFPAGLVSRKNGKIIKDVPWKKTFITKAKKYKRDIIPVFIDGKNSSFFYNLANLRKKLGIKANIEMLYLADEMFNQKGKNLTISFGPVIPYSILNNTFNDIIWAKKIQDYVYQLNNDNCLPFQV
jgi:1-acyl-sn-glycerol-3-phosphate acyltransferase